MVGVDQGRLGGMWTIAETFIHNAEYNDKVNLTYIATSTCGSIFRRTAKMLEGYLRILFALLGKKADIVHIHMADKGSVYRKGFVAWLSGAFGKKVIIQMHAGPIMDWYEGLSGRAKRRVRKIFDSADRVLVLGEYWRERLKPLVPEDKTAVLYNGSECPESNPYNADGRNILFLGVLSRTKGVYDLVDAVKRINDALPEDVKVYLCGADENGKMLFYIKEKGLENRIVMTGWISKEQRLALFRETQMVVLPSYFEALSMTIIEAMCYGIPAVTTNISTMRELLGEEIALVEPGDVEGLAGEILRQAGDRKLRERYSAIEYERAVSRFSVEKMVDSTLRIYEEIIRTD